jgi:hypothetical protein
MFSFSLMNITAVLVTILIWKEYIIYPSL